MLIGGLDVGTTGCKLTVYNSNGELVNNEYIEYEVKRVNGEHEIDAGASVEAEIGSMGAREGGGAGGESIYTDPDDAKKFAEETGIDALACAFGTAHGLYTKQPKLDFPRLEKIGKMVSVPLVMHGGSGVNPADYIKSIELGIRKINCYTYMAKAGGMAVEALDKNLLYHDIELATTNAMMEDAARSIGFFSMPQSDEYKQYIDYKVENVDEIVRRVIEIVKNKK